MHIICRHSDLKKGTLEAVHISYSRDALPPVGDRLRPRRDGRRVDGFLLLQLPGHAVVVHHGVRLHGRHFLVDELDIVEGDDEVAGGGGGRGGQQGDGEDKLGRREISV